jgi:hypothetical protein
MSNGFIYAHYSTMEGGSHTASAVRVSGNTASEETVLVNLPLLGPFSTTAAPFTLAPTANCMQPSAITP